MTEIARTLASLGLAGTLFLPLPARTQTAFTLSVHGSGELPGFRMEEAGPYLAQQMNGAEISGWHFVPQGTFVDSNRVELHFELLPYAGGQVRQVFPMREAGMDMHLRGTHRLVEVQARLFLNGEYQTMVVGQQTVQGGAQDPELAAFLIRIGKSLDNAFRAIDVSSATQSRAAP
jgi:hypothetical protein